MSESGESHHENPPESEETLWLLAASPAVWVGHFLASYLTAAVYCAKIGDPTSSLGGARAAIAVYTVLALAAITVVARRGLRQHRLGTAAVPHDFDSPSDRHRFLGFAAVLLSGMSAVAAVYVALAAVFVGSCR